MTIKNILTAIDFSEATPATIDKAAEMAQCFASKLWLIHIAAPEPDFVGYDTGPQCERDWRAKTLRQEHQYLQNLASESNQKGIETTPLLIQGATTETILKEAAKLQVDLIVMGSHGYSFLQKFLAGSVSDGVIRQALCPVLIVPAKVR